MSEFLKLALASAADWTRYTDPKVFGVFVFLGIGVSDLLEHASELIDAHEASGFFAWAATLSFYVACALVVATVVCASKALFPRAKSQASAGVLFFGHIATYDTPEQYLEAVKAADLDAEVAAQAWEVSRIAAAKVTWAQHAYRAVVGFLAFWAIGRIALELI